ncbi:MAG: hypothetical protein MUF42_05350 [Cytophagaceae bacterium]|jgi:hypothetical protein|nr:hypothetical protein [Cytophagaceae bacterium]
MFDKINKAVDKLKSDINASMGGGDATQKISITSITDSKLVVTAQFNPETITISSTLNDATSGSNGSSAAAVSVKRKDNSLSALNFGYETLKFDLLFDHTVYDPNQTVKLGDSINALYNLCYGNDNSQPHKVVVAAGTFLEFKGIITSFEVSHLLFDSTFEPIRTKITIGFKGFNNKEYSNKVDPSKSSENTLNEGDAKSLATYVAGKMGSPAALIPVAKANKLPNLMKGKSGTKLKTPGKKS